MQMKFKSVVGHVIKDQEKNMKSTIVNRILSKSRQKSTKFNTRFLSMVQLRCRSWCMVTFRTGKVEFTHRAQIKLLADIQLEELGGDMTLMAAFIGLFTIRGEQIGVRKELARLRPGK